MGTLFALLVPGVVVLASSSAAVADAKPMSLKERQAWDEYTKNLETNAATASAKCGTPISLKVDVASFQGEEPVAARVVHCRDALNTLTSLCELWPGSKEAIQRSVSSVHCRKATDGTKPVLKGKTLYVDIDSKKSVDGSWSSVMRDTLPAASPAAGEPPMTLRERQEWDERITTLDKVAATTSTTCGTKIGVKWDVASFRGHDFDKTPMTSHCRDAVAAVGAACSFSAAGKRAVQSSVGLITCHRSHDGTKAVKPSNKQLLIELDPAKRVNGSWKSALEEVL